MTTSAGAAQPTDVFVCNKALSHCGSAAAIQNLDSDQSPEAIACRLIYYSTRDEVLQEWPWPFARKYAQLGLVTNNPTSEWGFAYRMPSDYLCLRRICGGLRNDNRQSRVPYQITQDAFGLLIYTDWQNATQSTTGNPILTPDIEYTFQAYNSAFWPADFMTALSFKVAMYIAPQLGKGDSFGLVEKLTRQYQEAITAAQGKAANEEQVDQIPESEFMRFRDGSTGWTRGGYGLDNYQSFLGGFNVE